MEIKIKETKVTNSENVAEILKNILKAEDENDRKKEHFWVIGRKSSGVIEYLELVSLGTLDASLVHPRETFRLAILKSVVNIIVAHNHPSGNLEPSEGDIIMTDRLVKAGEIIGIEVIDHIIMSLDGGYYSFKSNKKI